MSDLYHSVKNLPRTNLKNLGFKRDALGEGFFKEISTDVSAVFHVTGAWSYVEIYRGLRFSKVNKLLYQEAIKAGWQMEKASMFKLKILGLFREKLGDFCGSSKDIGIYCPDGSSILSADDISLMIVESINDFDFIKDLSSSLDYVRSKELYEPFGKYMIPVAAKLCGRNDIWEWSVDYYSSVKDAEYIMLIDRIAAVLR